MSKVLIVDDEEGYRVHIAELLSEQSYTVATASTGDEAIATGRWFRPDLLVVDWMLKDDMDGFDVAHALRAFNPDIETILITGYPTPALEAKALGSRVRAVIYKPFTPEEICEAVRGSLESKRGR